MLARLLAALIVTLVSVAAWGQPAQPPPGAPYLAADPTAPGAMSTFARDRAARAGEILNVRDYGAACDNVHDDWQAFHDVITRVNATAGGPIRTVIHVPPGTCRIFGAHGPLPNFAVHVPGAIVGAGTYKTWIVMDASYVGDLFSWTEAWVTGVYVFPQFFAGPQVKDLTIQGDRASSSQNALKFYDRTDYALIENVTVWGVPGNCISFGRLKSTTAGGIRESNITNFRCFDAGMIGVPAVDFMSSGSGGGNPVVVVDLDIYDARGPYLSLRHSGTFTLNQYKFLRLRIEGKEGNTNSTQGDLMVIGDPSETSAQPIANIAVEMADFLSVPAGFCAVRVTGADGPTRPVNISMKQVNISVGGGTGKGLCLDAVRGGEFQISSLASVDTNVTLGALVQDVVIDGGGLEGGWTWNADPAALRTIRVPVYKTGVPNAGVTTLGMTTHDGSALGGNTQGAGSIDLQPLRSTAGQIALGGYSGILGGSYNTVNGDHGVIAGGYTNVITGPWSAIPGGRYASDGGRQGIFAYAQGPLGSGSGTYQMTSTVLRGSGATDVAFPITADALPNGINNCMNPATNTSFGFSIRLHARNVSRVGFDYDWYVPNVMLVRDGPVGATAFTMGTPVILTRGTVTGAAVSASPDTTNGCLNLTFTPPTGNTDTWDVSARLDATEVR